MEQGDAALMYRAAIQIKRLMEEKNKLRAALEAIVDHTFCETTRDVAREALGQSSSADASTAGTPPDSRQEPRR
jgi:hypothetical protein